MQTFLEVVQVDGNFEKIARVIEQILGIGMETFQNGVFFQGYAQVFQQDANEPFQFERAEMAQ